MFADQPLDPAQQRHWFDMRRAMVRYSGWLCPCAEAYSSLMRREHSAVSEELYPYFQKVNLDDHILRIGESSDLFRSREAPIVETNLSLRLQTEPHRQKVSSWAIIRRARTRYYYGMNVPYPGSGRLWGVVTSTCLMIAVSFLLYPVFRRNDWLSASRA